MFTIDSLSRQPLYEQLIEQLEQLVLTGVLEPGSRIPTVRGLSCELSVNPNTIQRAYRELESEGFIYSIAGKGSFAADRADIGAVQKTAYLERFAAAARELLLLGMTVEELSSAIVSYSKEMLQ